MTKTQLLQLPLHQRLVVLANDPVEFIRHCCYTRDEVNVREPVRLAPLTPGLEGYKPYLEPIINAWVDNQMVIVDKARRMWISYLMLCLHLHLAFTNTDRSIGIVSKKFEDSCAHLENMKRIYDAIPEDIYPREVRPAMRVKEGYIYFDEIDSIIRAVASGPDQMRQYGYTALFFDEMDFWENQESTYTAAAPTLQGGGKLTIATTHRLIDTGEKSFYRKLFTDTL